MPHKVIGKWLLTEAYIDDKEVGDVKRQHNNFGEQHNVELQLPVKITRAATLQNKKNVQQT